MWLTERLLCCNGCSAAFCSGPYFIASVADAAANCTNEPVCDHSTSGCRGTIARAPNSGRQLQESDELAASALGCAANLTGPFCQLCDRDNAAGRVHYVAASKQAAATCEPCGETIAPTVWAASAAATALIAMALLLWAIDHFVLSAQRKEQLKRAWKTYNLGVKIKVGSSASLERC